MKICTKYRIEIIESILLYLYITDKYFSHFINYMALSRRVYVNYELRETWEIEAMTLFIARPNQPEQTK
jgi:hypothetical protein